MLTKRIIKKNKERAQYAKMSRFCSYFANFAYTLQTGRSVLLNKIQIIRKSKHHPLVKKIAKCSDLTRRQLLNKNIIRNTLQQYVAYSIFFIGCRRRRYCYRTHTRSMHTHTNISSQTRCRRVFRVLSVSSKMAVIEKLSFGSPVF